MASNFTPKSNDALTWIENRERINLQLRQITRRITEVALTQASREYNAGLIAGDTLRIGFDDAELMRLVQTGYMKVLGEKNVEVS